MSRIKLFQHGNRYILQCRYEEREIPKSRGFRWDPNIGSWWTNDISKAAKLIHYAHKDLLPQLEAVLAQEQANIEASRAATFSGELPKPEGLEYLPYQKAGIAAMLNRPSTLLADEMGLGKTIQAIGVINTDPSIKRVLVICPATLKLNWVRELEKWLVEPHSISIAQGSRPKELPDSDILVINWDILAPWRPFLDEILWDLIIGDEAHYIKSRNAARTRALVGDSRKNSRMQPLEAKRKLLLTGTPILNRPVEAWTIINYLDPVTWHNFFHYAKRYCAARQDAYGWDMTGSSNLPELQEKLRSTIMVRRAKSDVLTELPPKRRQIIEISQNGYSGLVKLEAAAWATQEDTIERMKAEVAEAKRANDESYEDAVHRLQEAASIAFAQVSEARHELALAKTKSVIEHVTNLLESEDKVVVFAYHLDVLDAIANGMKAFNPVMVDGRVPNNERMLTLWDGSKRKTSKRQAAVDQFQEDPNCHLFLGQIQAAGVGITLTAASVCVFAELDWVPANISQAEDRLHRIGQTDWVLAQHLVVDGSLDAHMAKTLVAKQTDIDQALNDEAHTLTREDAIAHDAILEQRADEIEAHRKQWLEQKEDRGLEPTRKEDRGPELAIPIISDRDIEYPHVPNGRYAINTDDGHLAFYRVTSPEDGHWAGYVFVEQQVSDDFHAVRNTQTKLSILSRIAEDPQKAMLEYGRAIGRCGHCGRTLTNEESRAIGIGPICRSRWAWA